MSEYQQRIRTVHIWQNVTEEDHRDPRETFSRVTQLVLEHRFEPSAQSKVQDFSILPFSSAGFRRLSSKPKKRFYPYKPYARIKYSTLASVSTSMRDATNP